MIRELTDITIIGGGPTGLFALFYAGMRGARAQIVDALPQLGGQLIALYPEKYIFDVAGFPKILAKDLVKSLVEQTAQFNYPSFLNQNVAALETGGKIVIIGGGDSAFDWAQQLRDRAREVTLVHRSDRYRAHASTVADVQAAAAAGKSTLLPFHELHDIRAEGERLAGVTLRDVKTKATRDIDCDAILPMLGFHSDMGALSSWGIEVENDEIAVNSMMETGRPGVYAAGDVTTYPGKLKLIATGFGEAATAVNQAVHWIYPDKKVDPGHSSNMAVFGQKDD